MLVMVIMRDIFKSVENKLNFFNYFLCSQRPVWFQAIVDLLEQVFCFLCLKSNQCICIQHTCNQEKNLAISPTMIALNSYHNINICFDGLVVFI